MACFSLAFLEQFPIFLVVVFVIVGIIRLLLPALMNLFGAPPGGGVITTMLSYVLWGIVTVAVIIFAFDLIFCVTSGGFRLGGVR